MKNWKSMLVGFVAGAVSMVSVTALAGTYIQTYLMDNAAISIDGKFVSMPADQAILNYNSRIYVPLRFISENLGCDVNWDATNNFAMIKSNPQIVEKEVIKEVEKIVYVDSEESVDGVVYKTLPLKTKTNDYTIEITGIQRYTAQQATKVFITLNNTGEKNIELRYRYATLTVDGKEYKLDTFNDQDTGWMNSFRADPDDDEKEYDGFIYFEQVPENFSNCTLKLVLRTDTEVGASSDKTLTYNFKVEKN